MYKRNVSFCSYTVFNDRASTLVTGQLLCSLSNAIFQAISLHCRADLQHTVSASSRSCISIPLEEACDCSAVICIHVHETLSTAFVTSTMSARMTICLKGYLNITCVLHQVRAVFVPTNSRRKEKTTPFGIKLMRNQVLYQAAQVQQSNRRAPRTMTLHDVQARRHNWT